MPEPERPTPTLRLARLDEANAIDALMKASTRDLFPGWYEAEQTASAIEYVASVDRTLIGDGTYFVAEADGELVACGGWSRRDKMYAGAGDAAGDGRLLDPAMEPAPRPIGPHEHGADAGSGAGSSRRVKQRLAPRDSAGSCSAPRSRDCRSTRPMASAPPRTKW